MADSQERALEQLGGYNIVFGRQAAQLIAAHERDREMAESPLKTPSRHSRQTRGDASGGSSDGGAATAAKQTASFARRALPGAHGTTLQPHAEEHESAFDGSQFATGILVVLVSSEYVRLTLRQLCSLLLNFIE